jgi:ribonuclease Z
MEIVFLGTGSALPTKERMLSSMILNREGENYLFDCGEASQFQMMNAGVKPFKIKNIFITHLHGDHIYGLPGLISSMSLLKRTEPLTIFSPAGLKSFLDSAFRVSKTIPKYDVIINEFEEDFTGGMILDDPEFTVSAIPIEHSLFTLGYRFQEKDKPGHLILEKALAHSLPMGPLVGELKRGNPVIIEGREVKPEDVLGDKTRGKSVCYITDTKYSYNSIKISENADILVHESTFDFEMSEKAIEMKHSTSVDAARVAREAKARLLVLTHISSRNEDVEKLVNESKTIFNDTIAAHDFLRISI